MNSTTHPALSVLWGKSKAGPEHGPKVNLLLQHLLDTAAVGELIWDRWLAPSVRARIDRCCGGQGRELLALLCGLHDVGKASPAFQSKVPELAERVRATGLTWTHLDDRSRRWHHTLAGALIIRRVLKDAGWDRRTIRWMWPLVAGHHGVVPAAEKVDTHGPGNGHAQGRGPQWLAAQDALVSAVADAVDVDLSLLAPSACPRRAEQLAISGAIIMADWIASGSHFSGVDEIGDVSMVGARQRADEAWRQLELRGGWSPVDYSPVSDLVAERFGQVARPIQQAAVALAEQMPAAGLMMIEAPMGEGKTEAALAAAEVLARRFGADGVFVGMPTQATCDPMFSRVLEWARRVEPGTPVGLLHGKRRFNRDWRALLQQVRFVGIDECADSLDEFGCDDEYGSLNGAYRRAEEAPAEWFLGPKRGLLMPVAVGTVDQLLHAATRTRHVMLRHVGLAGRVVILDEVHAYDVYMAQFLCEALRWLADAGVPVILLSATLPPPLREQLAMAYLQGATLTRDIKPPVEVIADDAYPAVRSLCLHDGLPRYKQQVTQPWRASIPVRVEVLDEAPNDDAEAVVALLADALADGGCALVVRNTVGRAQQTYQAVKAAFGKDEALLLHGRLMVGERADRTVNVLDLLGPPGRNGTQSRPHRLVVVATQLAEQSFDVDVDLMVTDLAPIDLLLQRIGRLHRHARSAAARPARVSTPRVVVAGMKAKPDAAPMFPRGSVYVYGRHMLLRSAALVVEAAGGSGWSIPVVVPALVRQGYSDEMPMPRAWQADAEKAEKDWRASQWQRSDKAAKFLLAGEDALGKQDLAGLHDIPTRDLDDDDAVAAVVRDGPESVEVVVVRENDGRGHCTFDGRPIGVSAAAIHDPDIAEAVVQSAVRLPARPDITAAAKVELTPLPECGGDPWLRRTRALVVDEEGAAVLGGRRLVYDPELGLLDEPAP